MANMTLSGRAREILFAAAASLPRGDRREWNSNLAEYLRLKAIETADATFGAYQEACEQHQIARIMLTEKFGENNRGIPEADAAREAAFAPLRQAEGRRTDELLAAMWQAAANLIETPAPDIEALLLKVDLIDMEAMKDDPRMSRSCIEIIEEDAARLTETAHA